MSIKKILARDWTIEVYDGTDYQSIGGLTSFTLSSGKNNAETTDFESNGDEEHIPASRTKTISFEGQYKEDPDTGDRDAGQEEIESLSDKVGPDGIETIHLASPGGGFEVWMDGSFNLADIGGGNNDPASWGFEFERSGASMDSDPHAA